MLDVEQFWEDGFAIERGVFSPAEVANWREAALSANGSNQDLLSLPGLARVVLDPRLIARAEAILGARPIYFGDSTASIGRSVGGFHKDNSDRCDPAAPDWEVDRYPIIRFGIYTQSHTSLPGGLDLRRGSHLHADTVTGEWVRAETNPGDLIVWNSRTTHSGPADTLLSGQRIEPSTRLWKLLRLPGVKALLAKHPEHRVALFVSYAHDHPLLKRHIEYLRTRTYAVASWRGCEWSETVADEAEGRGLRLIPPNELLTGVSITNERYVQLAY